MCNSSTDSPNARFTSAISAFYGCPLVVASEDIEECIEILLPYEFNK